MEYTATKWQNGGPPAINASNLNKIEDGIATAAKELNTKTSVTVSGSNVATFDADTKQNKLTAQDPIRINKNTISVDLDYIGSNLVTNSSSIDYVQSCNDNFFEVDVSYIGSNLAGNGLYFDGYNLDIELSYIGPNLAGDGLHFDGCNLDIKYDSSIFKIDNNNQLTLSSNVLDTGLHGSSNSYIQNDGSGIINIISSNGVEIDAISGEIRIQGAYNSETGKATKIKVHNQVYGLVIDSSNSLSIGTVNSSGEADTAYLQINSNGANVPTPINSSNIANKKYVDDATYSYIQDNKLSNAVGIDIGDADITIIRAYSDGGIIFGPESDRWVELTIVKSGPTQSTTYHGCGIKCVSSNGSFSNFTPYCTSSTNAPQLSPYSKVFITKNKVHQPSN